MYFECLREKICCLFLYGLLSISDVSKNVIVRNDNTETCTVVSLISLRSIFLNRETNIFFYWLSILW